MAKVVISKKQVRRELASYYIFQLSVLEEVDELDILWNVYRIIEKEILSFMGPKARKYFKLTPYKEDLQYFGGQTYIENRLAKMIKDLEDIRFW